ncbi:MAG: threonine synthase [Candidatus Tectomicrobia bacterium]|uniref:Threonine synthase n=1 Tax=Tectimicrobiota bacterium TaxID=2528274 RepID=A0A933GM44_UNCTE|nr:threonine synthase [Candidatus Tectomicrobia bacterium]
MNFIKALKCKECGKEYPHEALYVCDLCFGPLEVTYDYQGLKGFLTKERISQREKNVWRFKELLPLFEPPAVGFFSGCTPLIKADRLAKHLGVKELYIKDDSVNHPTFSYKDRVVSVAISKAIELGFDTVSCASTGNLANSVSAHAAISNLNCYILIPADLEEGKVIGSMIYGPKTIAITGNYDDVNRLCVEVADKYGWAFVNINLRPYYTEGAKTYGFEIAEQLGWKLPQHIVVPTAGGTILPKIAKAFQELIQLGLVEDNGFKIYSAQAAGCAPVVRAIHKGSDVIAPEKPKTIAKSIAIGNPADGFYVLQAVRRSNGWGEMATDEEIVEAIKLLARTEGVFTEPAGGTTVAVTKKLIEQGVIPTEESIVIAITGNGYKTLEAVQGSLGEAYNIEAKLSQFDKLYDRIVSQNLT